MALRARCLAEWGGARRATAREDAGTRGRMADGHLATRALLERRVLDDDAVLLTLRIGDLVPIEPRVHAKERLLVHEVQVERSRRNLPP